MIAAILIAAAATAAAAAEGPRLQDTITVIAPKPAAIADAEKEFIEGDGRGALQLLDAAIRRAERTRPQDLALLADLYNCRAWITFKAAEGGELGDALRDAEGYAARAVDLDRENARYWHDYAAIRVRRVIHEEAPAKAVTDVTEYRYANVVVRPLQTIDDVMHFREALKECALRNEAVAEPDAPIVRTGTPAAFAGMHDDEFRDLLVRERAGSWENWNDLWRQSCREKGSETRFGRMLAQPSGDVRAELASTFLRLKRGRFEEANRQLLALHERIPATAEILFALTITNLASGRMADARGYYDELRRVDPASAMIVQAAGIGEVVDAGRSANATAVTPILFIITSVRPTFSEEALKGLRERDEAAVSYEIDRVLRDEIKRVGEQLATLTHDTARGFAAMEERAEANRKAIADLSDADRERFNLLLERTDKLQRDLHLTQNQVEGLSLGVVRLQQRVQTNFATLDRRLRAQRAETLTAIRLVEKSSAALAVELARQDERFTRFRTLHHREIATLTDDVNVLSHWQFSEEYRQALDRVSTLLGSLIDSSSPLGTEAVNFLMNLVGLGDEMEP